MVLALSPTPEARSPVQALRAALPHVPMDEVKRLAVDALLSSAEKFSGAEDSLRSVRMAVLLVAGLRDYSRYCEDC